MDLLLLSSLSSRSYVLLTISHSLSLPKARGLIRALSRCVSTRITGKYIKPAPDSRQMRTSHPVKQSPEMVLGINTTSPLKSHVLVFLLYKIVAFIYIFDECGISFSFCTQKEPTLPGYRTLSTLPTSQGKAVANLTGSNLVHHWSHFTVINEGTCIREWLQCLSPSSWTGKLCGTGLLIFRGSQGQVH